MVPQRAHRRSGEGDGGDEGAGSKDGFSGSLAPPAASQGSPAQHTGGGRGASNGMTRGSWEWWQKLQVPKGLCLVTGRWPSHTGS